MTRKEKVRIARHALQLLFCFRDACRLVEKIGKDDTQELFVASRIMQAHRDALNSLVACHLIDDWHLSEGITLIDGTTVQLPE